MDRDYGHWALSLKERLLLISAAGGCGLCIGWLFYDSVAFGLAVSVVLLGLTGRYKAWRIEQTKQTLLLQFRDLLYSISSSVSVGRSMEQALQESISFWQGIYSEEDLLMQELHAMVRRMEQSNDTALTVLSDLAARSHLPDIEDFVNVYASCRESGADLVQAIHRATDIIGDKITLERELRTLMAQKQFEGRIVLLSPFLVLLFLKLTAPSYLLPLTQTDGGRMVSTLALLLIGAAGWLMERVNRLAF